MRLALFVWFAAIAAIAAIAAAWTLLVALDHARYVITSI